MNTKFITLLQYLIVVILTGGFLICSPGCQQSAPLVYKVADAAPNTGSSPYGIEYQRGPNNRQSEKLTYSRTSAGQNQPNIHYPGYIQQLNWQATDHQTNMRFANISESNINHLAGASQYHIGAGDILLVKVHQLLDLEKETVLKVEVDRTGHIYLPIVTHMKVEGLTASDVQLQLVEILGTSYIRDPKVDVSISQYNSKHVMVTGQFNQPGVIALRQDASTLLDVINQAGGLSPSTAPTIDIYRDAYDPTGNNAAWADSASKYRREQVPISKLFAQNKLEQINPVIYPGDVIKVQPHSEGYVYLAGEFSKPGSKMYRRPLTILQAVACGGGTTNIAANNKCKIVRFMDDGSEREMMINLKKIREGKHDNILLAQNDVIMVPVDPWKKFWDDVDRRIMGGVRAGVDVTYDAAEEMGWPGTWNQQVAR